MKKQTGPDSVLLKTEEDLQTFIDHYDASIIGTMLRSCFQLHGAVMLSHSLTFIQLLAGVHIIYISTFLSTASCCVM